MAEYIEREAADNAILNLVPKVDGDGYCWVIRGDAARAIDSIPAADVRPVVRGKWESHGEGFKWVFVCSACGYVDGYPMNDRMNYCPNCGARTEES